MKVMAIIFSYLTCMIQIKGFTREANPLQKKMEVNVLNVLMEERGAVASNSQWVQIISLSKYQHEAKNELIKRTQKRALNNLMNILINNKLKAPVVPAFVQIRQDVL